MLGRWWKLFLAWTHWSDAAVCEMSRGRTKWNDFHDHRDAEGEVDDFMPHWLTCKCKRCGKEFEI